MYRRLVWFPILFIILIFAVLVFFMFFQSKESNYTGVINDIPSNMPPVPVEVTHHLGPITTISNNVVDDIPGIQPVNMYQEVDANTERITKVIIGSLTNAENQFALVAFESDGSVYKHVLPSGLGQLRIVGVGPGTDFFLQNESGEEFVFRLNLDQPIDRAIHLRSCPERCD